MENEKILKNAIQKIETFRNTYMDKYVDYEGMSEAVNIAIKAIKKRIPIQNDEEQFHETDCDFCKFHEDGDTLYSSSDWDGGIGFDYIRDIKFCPLCGKRLRIY